MLIGEYVRLKRAEQRLTQERLSELSGINRSYLSRLEKGHFKSPSLSVISKLAGALNIYTEELIKIVDIDARIIEPNNLPPFEEYIVLKFNLVRFLPDHEDLVKGFYKIYFEIFGNFPRSETRLAQDAKLKVLLNEVVKAKDESKNEALYKPIFRHVLELHSSLNPNPYETDILTFEQIEEQLSLIVKQLNEAKRTNSESAKDRS